MAGGVKRGRKNKYETHVGPRLEEIGWWCRDGLIEEEMFKRLGVSERSWYEYKNKYPQLSQVLKNGKAQADYRVEDSLYKRAVGIKNATETTEEYKDGVLVAKKIVKKNIAPDPTSMIFWLKNRQPAKWRDKQEIGGSMTINYNVPGINKNPESQEKAS